MSTRLKYGRGAIPWMAGNPVAANLLLLLIVAGGLLSAFTIKQEFFPEDGIEYGEYNKEGKEPPGTHQPIQDFMRLKDRGKVKAWGFGKKGEKRYPRIIDCGCQYNI